MQIKTFLEKIFNYICLCCNIENLRKFGSILKKFVLIKFLFFIRILLVEYDITAVHLAIIFSLNFRTHQPFHLNDGIHDVITTPWVQQSGDALFNA